LKNDKWKAKGITRKWDSNGVVDHTEDRTCQLRSYVGTSTLHPTRFFPLFSLFSRNFRFTSIFSLKFRLFYLRFRFRFLVFRIEVNHVKSGFFFASKRNEIFASISNFASEAKVRAHPIVRFLFSYDVVYCSFFYM
jgi:hypothetical protein